MSSYQRYLPGYSLHKQVPREKKKTTTKHSKAIKQAQLDSGRLGGIEGEGMGLTVLRAATLQSLSCCMGGVGCSCA